MNICSEWMGKEKKQRENVVYTQKKEEEKKIEKSRRRTVGGNLLLLSLFSYIYSLPRALQRILSLQIKLERMK